MSYDWSEIYARSRRPRRPSALLAGASAFSSAPGPPSLCSWWTPSSSNDIVHLLTLGPAPYVDPGLQDRFRHTAFFIGNNTREAVREGRADFMPVFLSDIPKLIANRRVRIDVALVQVSPPDSHGYVSLGVSVDIVRAVVDCAAVVLAEVNPHMPRTLGSSFLTRTVSPSWFPSTILCRCCRGRPGTT